MLVKGQPGTVQAGLLNLVSDSAQAKVGPEVLGHSPRCCMHAFIVDRGVGLHSTGQD